ncbi:F-BAR domain only protein 2 isoform X1 [Acanthochromis polyacanthus]|uniref:F-BAR domain only protein 2 isoform X1 n=1 Tax=Acanthochromis polyacanthus TaxID=80966 RepID=UPI002234E9F3|nr:F-BAR domain only protein 2 isoform X1 [Acanthochromis polyacanthus]
MITPYFRENFWGEKNNGFDVLYHNMKHGQISTKELTDFIRERSTIEEAYARSMTKLAKSAGNFSQLGTFAPVWDVFKSSTEKLATCHLELVRKLQELIKEVQKYVEEQAKAHKKTKEEVASTLEAVQNIQSISQALQKSKEIYNAKTVEQERLRKEGATQRDVDKAGVKAKKATETYKSYVEKYATAKSEFEQKMTETAQKFQDIEENHILHMKEIIHSYSQSVDETHVQIGEVHNEFVRNIENTSVEGLVQKLAESKGTGKERPGPVEFEECNAAIATEGAKPRKRKPFGIPGRRKDKDTDSTESTEVEAANTANGAPPGYYGSIDIQNANVPQVDAEGFCIRPEVNENDAKENSFYSSSDSDDEDEPRKFHVQIKPVQPNNGTHQNRATIDELKASIGNIILSPSTSGQMRRNQSRFTGVSSLSSKAKGSGDELAKTRVPTSYELTNNDLLSLDPFSPTVGSASSVTSSTDLASVFFSIPPSPSFLMNDSDSDVFLPEASAETVPQQEPSPPLAESQQSKDVSSFSSSTSSPWDSPENPFQALKPAPARAQSAPITQPTEPVDPIKSPATASPPKSSDAFSSVCWSQSQWIAFSDNFALPRRQGSGPSVKDLQRPVSGSARASRFLSDDSADTYCKGASSREDSNLCFTDVFSGTTDRAMAAAPSSKIFNVPAPNRPTTPLAAGALVPPPRPSSRPKLPTGKLTGINEIVRPFSPPKTSSASPPPTAPLARAESSSSLSSNASLSAGNTPTVGAEHTFTLPLSSPEPELLSLSPFFLLSQKDDVFIAKLPTFEKRCETPAGTSRGPSPVTLASQDALPIAVAFTESVNAYFKGADPTKCIVKITGDMTLSFPMGIIKVFTTNPSPAVLTFKLKNTSRLEQILPNQQLLFSDPSQSDSNSKDFWFNMQALTSYLRKASDQNPSASYYNVDILKYQVLSDGIHSTPLNLAVYWKCTESTTDLRVDYRYNPESMDTPGPLANVQILVPVDGGVTNKQSLPTSIWNSEQNKCLWKLGDISEKSENEGAGSLRAKFELSNGPSNPSTLAVQFMNEGSTLSGVDMELQGTGYRLSLNKKRFATGRYMADC